MCFIKQMNMKASIIKCAEVEPEQTPAGEYQDPNWQLAKLVRKFPTIPTTTAPYLLHKCRAYTLRWGKKNISLQSIIDPICSLSELIKEVKSKTCFFYICFISIRLFLTE